MNEKSCITINCGCCGNGSGGSEIFLPNLKYMQLYSGNIVALKVGDRLPFNSTMLISNFISNIADDGSFSLPKGKYMVSLGYNIHANTPVACQVDLGLSTSKTDDFPSVTMGSAAYTTEKGSEWIAPMLLEINDLNETVSIKCKGIRGGAEVRIWKTMLFILGIAD